MRILYVVSDAPGAGKTAVCGALAQLWREVGKEAVAVKPLSETRDGADEDAVALARLLGQESPEPPAPLGDDLDDETVAAVRDRVAQVAQGRQVVLVEGCDSLSPEDHRRLADALDAGVLVVSRHRPGMSGADLAWAQEAFGPRLAGLLINGRGTYQGSAVRMGLVPELERQGLPCIGVVPEDRRLLGVTVEAVARHLEARFLVGQDRADGLVEYFMIGVNSMDPGDYYFSLHPSKAVIVRGDRPDIQMAALQTPTVCLVATCGQTPTEYVLYEAEQEGVAVLLVETPTLATMERLYTVQDRARFDHPLKLKRMAELLRQHADIAALNGR